MGLQTRDQIQQILQQQVSTAGGSGSAAIQQQMTTAQGEIDKMQTNCQNMAQAEAIQISAV